MSEDGDYKPFMTDPDRPGYGWMDDPERIADRKKRLAVEQNKVLPTLAVLFLIAIVGVPIFALYKQIAEWDPHQDPLLPADCVCPSEPRPECDSDPSVSMRNVEQARREIDVCISLLKGR